MELDKLFEAKSKNNALKGNAINSLSDFKNIRVLVWTLPKTGTTTLAKSFQRCISDIPEYVSAPLYVVHCHSEKC